MSTLLETGATFQDLQEFLRLEGCAVCRYTVQSCHRYFDTLLYEGANDPAVHARFEQGGAFCPLHGETLLAWRDALATALIYGNLVSQRRRLLAHWRSGGLHGRGPRAADVDRTLPGRDCPACAAEREATTRACAVLAGGLRSGPLAAAWQASPGLCWPHFLTVRAQCAGPTRPLLDEVQDRGLGSWSATCARWQRASTTRARSRGLRRSNPPGAGPWTPSSAAPSRRTPSTAAPHGPRA